MNTLVHLAAFVLTIYLSVYFFVTLSNPTIGGVLVLLSLAFIPWILQAILKDFRDAGIIKAKDTGEFEEVGE